MEHRSWPDVPAHAWVLVPTGSFEQHGPHLPLHTDTTIAVAVAERAAEVLRRSGDVPVLVLPAITFGASGEHQAFPGTASIGTPALCETLVELVRSVATWAHRLVFVNGHGGNLAALGLAVGQLRTEGHDVGWVPCAVAGGDAHAGRDETSMMLHLVPHTVDMARAVAGNLQPLGELMPALVAGGVASVSSTGVLGDSRGASADEGARLLASIVDDVVVRVLSGRCDTGGLLSVEAVRQ
jgi:mycofactocin precursor peptide peptidase